MPTFGGLVERISDSADAKFGLGVFAGVLAFLLFVGVLYPAPIPVLVKGAVLGSLNALVAMGIVLVYRANRIINFAAGDLGAVAGVLAVSLIVGPGWAVFPALGAGFVAAIVLGAFIEFAVIRRFSKSPRLILTVATIALSSILAFVQGGLPRVFGYTTAPQNFPEPFPFTFDWFPVIFKSSHLLVVIVVPIVTAGLAAFFRFTRVGIAVRASAESTDRAALLGIPVKRIGTLVWVIATALSAIAVLLRAPIVGVAIGSVLGPGLLLRALAAAVIARMENLPIAFGVAVVLGMLEEAVFWATSRFLIADAVLFFVILGGLLLQRRGTISRADDSGRSSWAATREVRPIPKELIRLPEVRGAIYGLGGLVLVILVVLPLRWDASRVNLFSVGLIFSMIAVSLVVLTGWAGQISLGQFTFVAFGASVSGVLSQRGWDFFFCLLAAGVVGAVVAVAIGIPGLRIPGPFLAVTTLALALATGSFFLNREFFPWLLPEGRVKRPALFGKFDLESEHTYYYVLLGLLVLVLLMLRSFRQSRSGRALVAARDNSRAAQSYGVSPLRARLFAFALSGFVAAVAGATYGFHQHGVPQTALDVRQSIQIFSIVVIGGLGSLPGALLGAAYQTFINYSPFTRLAFTKLLGTGLVVLLILLFLPGGLGGLFYDLRDNFLRRVARRRGIIVPSLLADRRSRDDDDDEGAAALPAEAMALNLGGMEAGVELELEHTR
jgi:branched-chain amino acid transport system permease protein